MRQIIDIPRIYPRHTVGMPVTLRNMRTMIGIWCLQTLDRACCSQTITPVCLRRGSACWSPHTKSSAACETAGRLLEAASTLAPDVVIADLSMPEVNGIDACRHIKHASPQTKVILVTAGGDQWVARAAFRAGASGFVLKHSAADDLPVAIHTALAGDTYCTPAVGLDALDVC